MADSFNYISYGSASVDLENEIVLGRGRLFEYTAVKTAKRLERMDSRAIEFLKGLPTFLCSEISRSDASMVVRFGRMEEIQVDTKRVLGFFVPTVDFGRIAFEDERSAREAFGADEWQLHRTHWAVRSGDADVVLGRLVDLQPGRQDDVASSKMGERSVRTTEPPPLESNVVGTVGSVDGFLRLLYDRSGGADEAVFYRGHQDPSYQLSPSLMRKWPDGTWKHLANEHTLCKELLIAHDEEFAGDQYCFDRLVRMQHYGLPTRLLDITGNPLVALFFACHHTQGPATASGEVIVFHVDRQGIRYYDSDIVSCLANLSNLTSEQKNAIDLTLEETKFNNHPAVQKLLYEVRSEKGNFENPISPTDLGSVVCVKAKRTNTRIRSQDGAFLLFGHDASLPEIGIDGIGIERIEITNKSGVLSQLASIGVGPSTVYPSIEQTAGHLREIWLQTKPV